MASWMWSFLLFLVYSVYIISAQNLYCGDRECYDILEVESTASLNEIKKNYRRISLKYHPDKSKDPNATTIFQQVAAAYTVLSDKTKRAAYDYYLNHPEDFAYNNAMYYRHVYAPKSDLRFVLFGIVIILSIAQYAIQYTRYQQALEYFRKGDKVRRKAQEIQQERNNIKNTGKLNKKTKEQQKQELNAIVDELIDNLHITGGYRKPEIVNLLIVKVFLSPYYLFKYIQWKVNWLYRHSIKKLPYTPEEEMYLTCKALGISEDLFLSDEYSDQRKSLLDRKLWEEGQMEKMKQEEEEEFKKKYPHRYKKLVRQKKGHKKSYGCPDDDGDD